MSCMQAVGVRGGRRGHPAAVWHCAQPSGDLQAQAGGQRFMLSAPCLAIMQAVCRRKPTNDYTCAMSAEAAQCARQAAAAA